MTINLTGSDTEDSICSESTWSHVSSKVGHISRCMSVRLATLRHATPMTIADHTRDDILLPWLLQTTLVVTYYSHDYCRPHSWWHITATTIVDDTRDDILLPRLLLTTLVMTYYCHDYCRPHSWWHITATTIVDHTRDDILLPWLLLTTLVMTYHCHD
jgi:hypothetical protein